MAQDRSRWASVWNERRGRSHDLSEDPARRDLDRPGPESWCNMRAKPQASGLRCGNSTTSRIDDESVKNITSRSMPIPKPAAGGNPYSSARM